jgi:hypothetical protein
MPSCIAVHLPTAPRADRRCSVDDAHPSCEIAVAEIDTVREMSTTTTRVPSIPELLWPTLRAVREIGDSGTIEEIVEKVVEQQGFTDEQLAIPHGHGSQIRDRALAGAIILRSLQKLRFMHLCAIVCSEASSWPQRSTSRWLLIRR